MYSCYVTSAGAAMDDLSLYSSHGGAPLFHVEVFARFEPLDLDDRVEIEGPCDWNGEGDLEGGGCRDRFLFHTAFVRVSRGLRGIGVRKSLWSLNSRRDGSLVR
jgi:hypothetical protein